MSVEERAEAMKRKGKEKDEAMKRKGEEKGRGEREGKKKRQWSRRG